jgi:hypothetical protein
LKEHDEDGEVEKKYGHFSIIRDQLTMSNGKLTIIKHQGNYQNSANSRQLSAYSLLWQNASSSIVAPTMRQFAYPETFHLAVSF